MEYEHSQSALYEYTSTQHACRQPHVLMRPTITQCGDQWCALYGVNDQEGIVAYGATPEKAAQAWDLVWLNGERGCCGKGRLSTNNDA